ncbi:putative colanic acid biosynthesis acetyltransferase [Salmonirosea aquatica]|uniref:Putative colanic acid biosynthesis acetyltransferase n=1 Tax=Salmonirosea aquatica TaxID=2654236 RepID=A0A7C9FMU6_9BACT|nr:putative colanic acid biosynthesis acetyltransferase [Cytophagaceae bacterium SJW1-29]
MFNSHTSNSQDSLKRPSFSFSNKLKRGVWNLVWLCFCRWTPKPLHTWRSFVLRFFGAKIGKSNFIYPSCKIWAPWLLETEDVATIGPGVEIYNPGGAFLGSHSILSQDAYLCGATHDYNSSSFTYTSKRIVIEAYVWICAKAIVLPGVRCFEGSVLGAGSVTSKDLKSWTVYAGNPAVAVKERKNTISLQWIK